MEFLRNFSEVLPNSAASVNSIHLYLAFSLFVRYFLLTQCLSYRKLSHVPGPRLAVWSNLWIVGVLWRQQSHLEVYEVSKRYGIHAWFLTLNMTDG